MKEHTMVDGQRRSVSPENDDTEVVLDTGAPRVRREHTTSAEPANQAAGGQGQGHLGQAGEMDVNESAMLVPEAEGADIPVVEEKFRAADVREELNENPESSGGQGYVGQGLDPAGDVATGQAPLTPHLSANIGITRQEDYLIDAQEDRLADESDDTRERETR